MEVIENIANIKNNDQRGVFTPADVLSAFGAGFLVENICGYWIIKRLHPETALCPKCGGEISHGLLRSYWDCKRIRCDFCGKYFTALTGTFLSGTHFQFREIILLSLLIALGVPDQQIATILKTSPENVRLWKLKFKAQEEINKGAVIG